MAGAGARRPVGRGDASRVMHPRLQDNTTNTTTTASELTTNDLTPAPE
jgi:hypothetical protein